MFSSSPHVDDGTFLKINSILSMDVDASNKASLSNYLVVDTNTLINNLSTVQGITTQIETQSIPLCVVVPGIVVQELDSLKNGFRDNAWRSRIASKWILKKLLERQNGARSSCIRGQAFTETCLRSGNWKKRSKGVETETNDDLIVDCACYFQKGDSQVWLWSGDVQLCAQACMQSLLVIYDEDSLTVTFILNAIRENRSIAPGQPRNHVGKGPYDPLHHGAAENSGEGSYLDAGMDIDEDGTFTGNAKDVDDENMRPIENIHPLDELHEQIVHHFEDLLRDLVMRACAVQIERGKSREGKGLMASIYAPKPHKERSKSGESEVSSSQEMSSFACRDSIQYLAIMTPPVALEASRDGNKYTLPGSLSPSDLTRLSNFLTLPYNSGARRGRDWTRGDWRGALSLLEKLGDKWRDDSLLESLGCCKPVVENTFLGMDT